MDAIEGSHKDYMRRYNGLSLFRNIGSNVLYNEIDPPLPTALHEAEF